jgi:murein DD-endopeptidase MepM/ murein hydrolase activator NlpD
MIRPTTGRITSKYGFRIHPIRKDTDFHPGIDFGMLMRADDVSAVADGVVKYKQFDAGGYGYYLVIEHDGYCSLYAHLRDRIVNIGDKVTEGQKIAVKGTSGSSTGIHLHFEIRECPYSKFWQRFYNGEWKYAVDPEKFYLERGFNMNKKEIKIPKWAMEAMKWAVENGINDGIVQNETELQTVVMLYRYHKLGGKNE